MTDKHERLREVLQAAKAFDNSHVMVFNSDLYALLAEWDALLDQHRQDSKELRRLCAQRDAARKVSKEAGAVVAALRAEMDALRAALEVIKNWPITNPPNMDAHNMAVVAQAALARGKA